MECESKILYINASNISKDKTWTIWLWIFNPINTTLISSKQPISIYISCGFAAMSKSTKVGLREKVTTGKT